jgi:hypothetical protein
MSARQIRVGSLMEALTVEINKTWETLRPGN